MRRGISMNWTLVFRGWSFFFDDHMIKGLNFQLIGKQQLTIIEAGPNQNTILLGWQLSFLPDHDGTHITLAAWTATVIHVHQGWLITHPLTWLTFFLLSVQHLYQLLWTGRDYMRIWKWVFPKCILGHYVVCFMSFFFLSWPFMGLYQLCWYYNIICNSFEVGTIWNVSTVVCLPLL